MNRHRTRSATRKPYLSDVDGGPLLAWYDQRKRDLPGRRTNDPYAIWVSEVMLQQTQVATVIPYWERWMSRFPTVESLAQASEQEVLSYWQGLGYYRRCRLLLLGAKWVSEHGLPTTVLDWLKVPGVGEYTAGAIASIAQGIPAPLVDGNVERVFARVTADPTTGSQLKASAWQWAEHNLYDPRPGDWNQALMELGATVCIPREPICEECPRQTWRVEAFPTKPPRPKLTHQRHVVWIPEFEGHLGVRQIPGGQWWEGMWEFPRVDVTNTQDVSALEKLLGPSWMQSIGTIKHAVTTHRIVIDAYYMHIQHKNEEMRWLSLAELEELPMPAPQRKLLKLLLQKSTNGEINRSLGT